MESRTLMTLAARLLLYLAAILLFLRLIENRLIFYPTHLSANTPPPEIPGAKLENEWLTTADHLKINAWCMAPQAGSSTPIPTILFLHGNAGTLDDRASWWTEFILQGWRVFALEYRGYGRSAGSPNEQGLYLDADAAYEYLTKQMNIPPDQIFVFGESLGSAVAIKLASEKPIGGLILESAFTSFRDMGRAHYPWIPGFVYRFLKNDWNSLDRIRQIHSPKIFIHGEQDTIVPFEQGKRLYDASPSPKYFYPVPRADHNDCMDLGGVGLLKQLNNFIHENFPDGPAITPPR